MSAYLGIDISKDFFDVCLLLDGKEKHHHFDNDMSGFVALVSWIQKHKISDLICCMEATGVLYEDVADYLSSYFKVSVVNPVKIKKYGQSVFQRTKTDKADALLIADFARVMDLSGRLSFRDKPSDSQYLLDRTLSLLNQLVSQKTMLLNQLSSSKELYIKRIFKRQIDVVNESVQEVRKVLNQIVSADSVLSENVARISTVSGIGELTAVRLLAHLTGKDFSNQRQFVAYLGLNPHISQSGTSVRGRGGLSGMGNRKARASLYMSAVYAYRKKVFFEFQKRMEEKGKRPKVIITAIMRKLAVIAFNIYKSGQVFDKSRYEPL